MGSPIPVSFESGYSGYIVGLFISEGNYLVSCCDPKLWVRNIVNAEISIPTSYVDFTIGVPYDAEFTRESFAAAVQDKVNTIDASRSESIIDQLIREKATKATRQQKEEALIEELNL